MTTGFPGQSAQPEHLAPGPLPDLSGERTRKQVRKEILSIMKDPRNAGDLFLTAEAIELDMRGPRSPFRERRLADARRLLSLLAEPAIVAAVELPANIKPQTTSVINDTYKEGAEVPDIKPPAAHDPAKEHVAALAMHEFFKNSLRDE